MSATGNTTPLMDDQANGTIGARNFADYGAKQISVEVSRRNYRQGIKSDRELDEFRQIVYKMVSGWAMEDKIAQITEYGDASQLQKHRNPSEDTINKILTESIIVHLNPEDLRRLRLDMAQKTNKVRRGIDRANKNADKIRRTYKGFNTATFKDAAAATSSAKNAKQFRKKMKDFDPSYRVPKYIERQYTRLRKELLEVLTDCFNKVELTGLADSMGIEIPEKGNQFKELTKLIINKVCLYVDLIVGKGKKNYGNAIMNPEPYNKILKYTSYSYITGEPGLDPNAWAELKREARRAKKTIQERARRQSPNKFKGTGNAMSIVTGGKTSKTLGGLARKIKNDDTGILADLSFEELVKLAGRYGIDPTAGRNKNIGILKAKIYNGMRNDYQRTQKFTRSNTKLSKKGKFGKKYQINSDLLSVYDDLENKDTSDNDSVESVPIVEFKTSGEVKTGKILKAVPVYIIGQGLGGVTKSVYQNESEVDSLMGGSSDFTKLANATRSSRRKLDPSLVDESKLPQNQLDLYKYFLSLPIGGALGIDFIGIPKNLKISFSTITQLKLILLKQNFPEKLVRQVEADSGSGVPAKLLNSDPDSVLTSVEKLQLRLRFLYLYALHNNFRQLQSFLTNKFGFTYDLGRFQRFTRGFKHGLGKVLKTIFFPITAAAGIIKGVRQAIANIKQTRFPQTRSQLPEKDRDMYDKLEGINDKKQLVDLAKSYGLKNDWIAAIENETSPFDATHLSAFGSLIRQERFILDFLRAIVAWADSRTGLARLFLIRQNILDYKGRITSLSFITPQIPVTLSNKKPPITYWDVFKLAVKRLNPFVNIARAFKRITRGIRNAVKGPGRLTADNPNLSGNQIINSELNIKENNDGQLLFLPKIEYKGNGTIDQTQIKEVIPVFVVNDPADTAMTHKATGGPIHTNHMMNYNKMIGSEYSGGHNIKLTKTPKEIIEAMDEKGYRAKTPNIRNKTANIGDTIIIHNDDMDWAIKNNFRFASGGYTYSDTFITGDARGNNIFAGGAKPELIQTFSRTPVLSKITPIKKFAEGGISMTDAFEAREESVSNDISVLKSVQGLTKGRTAKKLNKSINKLETILADIEMRSNMAQAITDLGGEVPNNIMTMKPKALSKALNKAIKVYLKARRKGKDINPGAAKSKLSQDAESLGIGSIDTKKPAMPVFVVNEFAHGSKLLDGLDDVASGITSNFNTLMTGLAVPMTIAAPYGAGTALLPGFAGFSTANTIGSSVAASIKLGAQILQGSLEGMTSAYTGGKITRAYTGGKIPRFVTGGSAVKAITGDAAGKNIFAGGAKPELVKSTGDLEVVPLNKSGEANNVKIDRMTPQERKDALATSIASHVIKFSYALPEGSSEVSNVGEAIKVFDVKPGISDYIDLNGKKISLIDLIVQIQGELAGLTAINAATTEAIAGLASIMSQNIKSNNSSNSEGNPFAGTFPNSLNGILGGN